MTPQRPPKIPTVPKASVLENLPADPLADLREPEPTDRYDETTPGEDDEIPEPQGLVTQDDWDAARVLVIASWHADTTSVGFLHKGGRCGCHYLAGVALTAAMPIVLDAETDPIQEN